MSTVFDKTVCLTVTFHLPGAHRRADLTGIETDADKDVLKLTKRIFDSASYKDAQRLAGDTRKWLRSRSLPSPLAEGSYLIPKSLVDEVVQKLDDVVVVYNELGDEFAAEYPTIVEEWKERLRSQYDARNYPNVQEVRSRFRVSRMFVDFQLARPDQIDQSSELQEAMVEIKAALRFGLLGLVQKLASMLGERKDGKKKGLRGDAVERFKEWMELLPARNILDDAELVKVAAQARALMSGKSMDDLRDIGQVRDEVRQGMEEVAESLKGLVKDLPCRAFSLDDE